MHPTRDNSLCGGLENCTIYGSGSKWEIPAKKNKVTELALLLNEPQAKERIKVGGRGYIHEFDMFIGKLIVKMQIRAYARARGCYGRRR